MFISNLVEMVTVLSIYLNYFRLSGSLLLVVFGFSFLFEVISTHITGLDLREIKAFFQVVSSLQLSKNLHKNYVRIPNPFCFSLPSPFLEGISILYAVCINKTKLQIVLKTINLINSTITKRHLIYKTSLLPRPAHN